MFITFCCNQFSLILAIGFHYLNTFYFGIVVITVFLRLLKLIKTFSSVSENNTVVNIIVQTIKGSRKNWGIIFFSVEFKILTRKNGVFLNSMQEFIEIEELAASDLFHMFTKPVKYYIFHCHILKSSGVHQIERSGCSFQ